MRSVRKMATATTMKNARAASAPRSRPVPSMVKLRLLLRLPASAPETQLFDRLCRRHFGLDPEASDEDALRGVLRSSVALPTATDAELLTASLCRELKLEPGSPPLAILRAYVEYGDPNGWRRLADANAIDDPLRIRDGTVLHVPPA